jgi:small subunit ribosomal protein S24e
MYLIGTTRLDLLSYMLFGAYRMELTERGLDCDEWLPIVGKVAVLNDIQQLKALMEACMLRVFEGVSRAQRNLRTSAAPGASTMSAPRHDVDAESGESDDDLQRQDRRLSETEVKELDFLTRDIVNILNGFSEERLGVQSTKASPSGICLPVRFR